MPIASTTASAPVDPVQSWRRERLEAVGYTRAQALMLSERVDIDLHLATRLIEDGCPPPTAVRILL